MVHKDSPYPVPRAAFFPSRRKIPPTIPLPHSLSPLRPLFPLAFPHIEVPSQALAVSLFFNSPTPFVLSLCDLVHVYFSSVMRIPHDLIFFLFVSAVVFSSGRKIASFLHTVSPSLL